MSEVLKIPHGLNPASYAVADAMMVAQAKFIENQGYNFNKKPVELTSISQIETYLQVWTHELCHIGSGIAAEYLVRKYRNLFLGISIMRTSGQLKESWNFHEVFIAQDKKNIWYVGSPANFNPNKDRDRMTRIISSPDLVDVLKVLEDEDGGVWPEAEFIEKTFAENPKVLPQSAPPDGFYCDGIELSSFLRIDDGVKTKQSRINDRRYLVGKSE